MNLTKFFRSGLATILVLIVGLVMLLTLGFNKGYDFTGGTVVEINPTTVKVAEAKTKITNVLKDNNLVAYSMLEGKNDAKSTIIVVKYQIDKDVTTTNNAVENALYQAFGYDKNDIVEKDYVSLIGEVAPAYTTATFNNAILALLIVLVACSIYVTLRFNFATSFSMIAQGLLDFGLMMSVVTIFRIQVSAMFGVAILATTFLSVIGSYMMLNALNKKAMEEKFIKAPIKDVVDVTVNEQSKKSFVFALFIIVSVLVLSFITTVQMSNTLIAVGFGALAMLFTSIYITPILWSFAFKRVIRQPKAKVAVEIEKEIL